MSGTMILNNNNHNDSSITSVSPNSGCNSPSGKKRVTHNPYRFGMELQKQRDSSAHHAVAVIAAAADEHSTHSSCHNDLHRRSDQHFLEDEDSAHSHPAAFLGSHNSYPISETPSYESSERSPSASEDDNNAAAMMMMMPTSMNSSNNSSNSNGYNAAYFPNVAMMSGSGHHNYNHNHQHHNQQPMRSNAASRTHSGINLAFGSPSNSASSSSAVPLPPPTYYNASSSSSLTPTNSGLNGSSVSAAANAAAAPMLPLPAELILGKSFPHAMPVRNKSIICKRFLEAKCINRNPNVAVTPCCQLGGACPFRHVTRDYEEPVPKSICKFHLNGACLRDVCPFFHGTRAQLSALHASGATMYRPSDYWCIVDAQDPTDRCDCARRHK